MTLKELEVRCLGAAAGTRLRGQKYGLMGFWSLGMLTAAVDANQWRRNFGIEVESWDQLEVVRRRGRCPTAPWTGTWQWSREVFGAIQVHEAIIRAAMKLYVAPEHHRPRGFDFVSVRCLPETPKIFTTFCYAIALLNDTSDAEGTKMRSAARANPTPTAR